MTLPRPGASARRAILVTTVGVGLALAGLAPRWLVSVPEPAPLAPVRRVRVLSTGHPDAPEALAPGAVRPPLPDAAELVLPGITLRGRGVEPRGLAVDPATGHLHVLGGAEARLFELAPDGRVLAERDLSELRLAEPVGMLFAPSGDRTDDPARTSLYLTTRGDGDTEVTELSLAGAAPATAAAVSSLVRTIQTWQLTPPSPDPAGVAYLPGSDSLLVSDSEVNEMPIFTGDNLFDLTRAGALVGTRTTVAFSDEPTGVDVHPTTGDLFFSDDTGTRSVYQVALGPDGLYGTPDDVVTSFSTEDFGSFDPEGVAYGLGELFVADGVNAEVYRIAPGPNGLFDGVDDQVSSFDTEVLGVLDPEGIAFHPISGNLFVIGEPRDRLAEITTAGVLVQFYDVSAADSRNPAGLAIGPGSLDPGSLNVYIADRWVDNNTDPQENDGRLYEMTLLQAAPSVPVPRATRWLVVLALLGSGLRSLSRTGGPRGGLRGGPSPAGAGSS